MKNNITLFIAFLFFGFSTAFAQSSNEDCLNNMSLFAETVKAKKCEEAVSFPFKNDYAA